MGCEMKAGENTLKNCPFCGNIPELYVSKMSNQYDNVNNRAYTNIKCSTCRLPDGSAFMVVGEILNDGPNPVIKFWNNRA